MTEARNVGNSLFDRTPEEDRARYFGVHDVSCSNRYSVCVISGFRYVVNEIFTLVGCCTALIDSYRRFTTTYRSHLQGASSPIDPALHWVKYQKFRIITTDFCDEDAEPHTSNLEVLNQPNPAQTIPVSWSAWLMGRKYFLSQVIRTLRVHHRTRAVRKKCSVMPLEAERHCTWHALQRQGVGIHYRSPCPRHIILPL
jgi:hypothetical protein